MTNLIITDDSLKEKLVAYAYEKSDAFCYGCYKVVKPNAAGRCFCPTCHSDDLMRHVGGVGVEYGIDWVVEALIKENCEAVDLEKYYEEWLSEIYSEPVKICGIDFDPAWALKQLDPIAYELGQADMISANLDDGCWIEIDGEYYTVDEVENFLS